MPRGALVLRTHSEERERGRFGGWGPPRLGRPQPSAASARQQPRPSGTHASLRAVVRCRAPPSAAPRGEAPAHVEAHPTPHPLAPVSDLWPCFAPSPSSAWPGGLCLLGSVANPSHRPNPGASRAALSETARPGPPSREVTHSALVDHGWSALHVSREASPVGREGPQGPWRKLPRGWSASEPWGIASPLRGSQ